MKSIPPILFRIGLILSLALIVLAILGWQIGRASIAAPCLIFGFVLLAMSFHGFKQVKASAFTIWIFAAVATALVYPTVFTSIGGFDLKILMIPLLQIIMFGMGTAMSIQDFLGVIRMPKGVLIGLLCQFTIMPFVGLGIATSFGFSPEIAAGIILVGASPSGLASNVMAYIAKANLALSVTLTAVATLLAPLMTPFLMETLAGQFVPIDFLGMMWSITKIVILPIAAGLLFNHFLRGKAPWLDRVMPVISMGGIAFIIGIITAAGREDLLDIGLLLVLACLIHNLSGYGLGYLGGKLMNLDKQSCRTIALEVGLQNSGLASGIAMEMGKIATVGLAAVVFSPLMNITGSSLASWWRNQSDIEEQSA